LLVNKSRRNFVWNSGRAWGKIRHFHKGKNNNSRRGARAAFKAHKSEHSGIFGITSGQRVQCGLFRDTLGLVLFLRFTPTFGRSFIGAVVNCSDWPLFVVWTPSKMLSSKFDFYSLRLCSSGQLPIVFFATGK
jgi:hypothetical protein